MNFNNYENALKYGAKIVSSDLDSSSVTGVKTSLTKHYVCIAVPVTAAGTSLFGGSAPTSGTITGFYTSAASATAGSATLWATTAGTIAAIQYTGTVGTVVGTALIAAAIVAGDSVTVTNNSAGSATAYVTFVTAV